MLDSVVVLLSQTSTYCNWTVKQICNNIIPPIYLKQYVGIIEDKQLKAWVTWAFLSKETSELFLDGKYKLQPKDWHSGTYLVFMDFVAPYGHTKKLHRLCYNIFKDYPYRKVRWRRHIKNKRVGVNVYV